MNTNDNLHAGHRERMIAKLLKSPETFTDHELLETLLFFLIPRKDTNALAHLILNSFGSLTSVFDASAKQLKKVKGVGDKVASGIVVLGQLMKRIINENAEEKFFGSFKNVKSELFDFFKDKKAEVFLVLLLDKHFKLLGRAIFTDDKKDSVSLDVPELADAIQLHKPAGIILAHNHLSSSVEPSEEDIFTTQKIGIICEVNSVKLIDHVIVSGSNAYSLEREGLLEDILKIARLNNLFNTIKKLKEN